MGIRTLGSQLRALLVAVVAQLWIATLRLTLVVDERTRALLGGGRPIVLVFWHGQQMPLLRWTRGRRMVALVSLSRDGELQARALPRLGIAVERGSSSRGGARGLRGVVRRLRDGFEAAFAVDGPRGPARVVRDRGPGRIGATTAARLSGGVVVAMAAACSASWVARSWDRFVIPRPFARVAVALGPPLEPEAATPEAITRTIDAAHALAESALGGSAADPLGDVPAWPRPIDSRRGRSSSARLRT